MGLGGGGDCVSSLYAAARENDAAGRWQGPALRNASNRRLSSVIIFWCFQVRSFDSTHSAEFISKSRRAIQFFNGKPC
jgi:hypothetical protein